MRNSLRLATGLSALTLAATALAGCGSSGTDNSKPLAKIDALSGQNTAVALDAGFLTALTTLKLTPGVVGAAKLDGTSLSFPITGGNVTYYKPFSRSPYVTGDIKHDGSGLSLTAGGTKVELTNFDIDPGGSRLYGDVDVNGTSAAKHAYIFNLDGSTLMPLSTPTDSTAVLEGTKVEMSPDAASLLNSTFKTDAVKEGLLIGIAKITVNTK